MHEPILLLLERAELTTCLDAGTVAENKKIKQLRSHYPIGVLFLANK
ncbi:hypothetical protein [Methylobacter psychrophilus]|nr:hypothetical protein [Methylobacter psychrophilus]